MNKVLRVIASFPMFLSLSCASMGLFGMESEGCVHNTAQSDGKTCNTSLEISAINENTFKVTGGGIRDGLLEIPRVFNGQICHAIGTRAFSGNVRLSKVVMPNTITTIEEGAFSDCSNLTSVAMEDVECLYVQSGAFANCILLGNIIFPQGLTLIDEYAFSGCTSLKSVKLPRSCEIMGETAFMNCYGLEKADIGYAGRYLASAFIGCSNLTEICVAPSNEFLRVSSGVLYSKNDFVLIKFPARIEVDHYVVKPGVEIISRFAFQCARIKSVELPSGLKLIGRGAFSVCTNLTSVEIPASVVLIEDYAFSMCSNLVTVTFKGDKRPKIGEGTFPAGVVMMGGVRDKCKQ